LDVVPKKFWMSNFQVYKMISNLLDLMLDWAENLGKNRKGHIDWMVRFSTSMMIGSNTTPQFPKQQIIQMTTRPKIIGLFRPYYLVHYIL